VTSTGDAAIEAPRDLFRYHEWATLQLIDHCATLDEDQLSATAAGTRGSIIDTFRHIVGADQRYQRRFGVTVDPVVDEKGGASLDALRSAVSRQAGVWLSIIDRLQDFDITIPAQPENEWPVAPGSQDLLLVQAIHHGNDHRTHICTILGSAGLQVPDVDGWSYWAAERVPR